MHRKSIFTLLLLAGSAALGQQTPASPSSDEVIKTPEAATLSSAAGRQDPVKEEQVTSSPNAQPNPGGQGKQDVGKQEVDSRLAPIDSRSLKTRAAPAKLPSNEDLLAKGKTIFVVSNTYFVKKEQMERGLLNRKELQAWGFRLVENKDRADLILQVERAPFQNNFPFTITDRVSNVVVVAGEVNSLFGNVPDKISAQVVEKLKGVYKEAK
jgi:hypothetical protein